MANSPINLEPDIKKTAEASRNKERALENLKVSQLNKAFDFLFSKDLWDRAKLDPSLFDELFVDRKVELASFERLYPQILMGKSVVIIGRIGNGKSGLLHKINKKLSEDGMLIKNKKIATAFLDLEERDPQSSRELIKLAVDIMTELLDELGGELSFHLPNPDVPAMTAVHALAKHLGNLWIKRQKDLPHILFFIDDLDYKPKLWYDLVMGLRPIFSLPCVSPVYAARPLLASRMYGAADDRIKSIMSSAKQIRIAPLPISEIIGSRLRQVAEQPRSFWETLLSPLLKYDKDLIQLLEKVGFRKGKEFQYPFAVKLEQFLEKSTNGNARLIMAMVEMSLQYILKNRSSFKPYEDGIYHFKRPIIMELFSEAQTLQSFASMPIIDLNDSRFLSFVKADSERTGNPLLYNILEWIENCEGNEPRIKNCFGKLGHTKEDIIKGLEECLASELIEPYISHASTKLDDLQIQDYVLSPKGLFHLTHLTTWIEYTKKYGSFKGKIDRSYYTKPSPQLAMYMDIIEFLQYIVVAIQDRAPQAKEINISLTKIIQYYVKYQTTYFSAENMSIFSPDNPDSDYMIDEPKLDYLFSNPPVPSGTSRKRVYQGKYVVHSQKKPHVWRVKLNMANILSVSRALKIASDSQLDIRERCNFQYFETLVDNINYK